MSLAPSRVLVTGATGFLGGHVVRDLQSHGHEVFGSGRDETRLAEVVDEAHRVPGDLASLADRDLPTDAVVHCAALSTPWGRWSDFRRANIEGTAAVVSFARRNGVRRVVHVSSPSIYAEPRDRVGIREEDFDPRNRLNGYIRSKIAAEELLQQARRDGAFSELVIIRPRGLIGIGDPSLVPRLLEVHRRLGVPLFHGGRNVIDVTAVENVAVALRLALTYGDAAGGVYNITNDDPREFRALLLQLLGLLGEEPRLRAVDRRVAGAVAAVLEGACSVLPGRPEPLFTRYTLGTIAYSQTLDISRAKEDLGYRPEVGLDEALARVAAHLRGES